jgi:diguanylate cyclase (GGDEF)-like protein
MSTPQQSTIDEEYSQALARMALSSVAFAVCLGSWFRTDASAHVTLVTSAAVGTYCVFAAAWILLLKRWPGRFPSRRVAVILCDVGITTFGTHMLGALGASFYPLYLWIIVGNGIRYGPRHLYVAMATGLLGFGGVVAQSSYWQQQLPMGVSLWTGLLVLPLFYLSVIRRMHGLNAQLVAERTELLRTREQLNELATRDGLTGLFNRRTVLDRLNTELERSRRLKEPLAIVMADLDHFKQVNDTYGHQAGDAVLKEVSARILAGIRPYDFAGRYGGEEFIVVLPGVSGPLAMQCANRLREAICRSPVRVSDGTGLTITCSFGLMSLSNSGVPTSEDLIRQADAALYVAKRQGRNRVEECLSADTAVACDSETLEVA